LVLEYIFHGQSECSGDPKRQGEGGDVSTVFEKDDGLSRATGVVGQVLLRHFVVVETQLADPVVNRKTLPGRHSRALTNFR